MPVRTVNATGYNRMNGYMAVDLAFVNETPLPQLFGVQFIDIYNQPISGILAICISPGLTGLRIDNVLYTEKFSVNLIECVQGNCQEGVCGQYSNSIADQYPATTISADYVPAPQTPMIVLPY